MDGKLVAVVILVALPIVIGGWKTTHDERRLVQDLRTEVHNHQKRHMLASENEVKKRVTSSPWGRELRKKPSGHLAPLEEDDIHNDEVVSVAVGPPPNRLKFEKLSWKHPKSLQLKNNTNNSSPMSKVVTGVSGLVKDILTELGKEFMAHQVSEDFVFGQYVSNSMKNLTSELKLRMQHDVLDLVVRYQKLNMKETSTELPKQLVEIIPTSFRELKIENKSSFTNDTEETWPDFSNIAKIVG